MTRREGFSTAVRDDGSPPAPPRSSALHSGMAGILRAARSHVSPLRAMSAAARLSASASLLWAMAAASLSAQSAPTAALRIYLDADRTTLGQSADAIDLGMRAAFAEIGGSVEGREVEFVRLDHRGNVRRTGLHLEAFAEDPAAIAFVGGQQSSGLLRNLDRVNAMGALTLLPWATAAPLTRGADEAGRNWVFRLSVDDSKAVPWLATYALETRNCARTALLLVNTDWGRSAEAQIDETFRAAGQPPPPVLYFDVGLDEGSARDVAARMHDLHPDCVILIANANESAWLVSRLAALPEGERPRILSHWGVASGDFERATSDANRERVDLTFLQTCHALALADGDEVGRRAIHAARALAPTAFDDPAQMQAPAGFVHAYDLGKLLIAAIRQAGLSGDIGQDRAAVRAALETLESPVEGLLKRYDAPFSPPGPDAPDAHEALGAEDLCIARFAPDGRIMVDRGGAGDQTW